MSSSAGSSPSGFRALGERVVHDGHVIRVVEGEFETPEGERIQRDIVRHPGAVAVVAVEDDQVVLVRQFRAALGCDVLEIPAGKRDVVGEEPRTTAARELVEEVGLAAGSMEPLAGFHNSVGFCDEYVHVFLATDLEAVPVAREGAEEQHMTIVRLDIDDAVAAIDQGEITDAKTVVGVLALLRRLGR